MSLADFALPPRNFNRPHSARKSRRNGKAFKDLSLLLDKIHGAKSADCDQNLITTLLSREPHSRVVPIDSDYGGFECVFLTADSSLFSPHNEHSRLSQRPWSAPARTLLKRKQKDEFQLKTLLPDFQSVKKYHKITLPKVKPLKIRQARRTNVSKINSGKVEFIHLEDRLILFERRDLRIENAAVKRNRISDIRMKKLREDLQRKDLLYEKIKKIKHAEARQLLASSVITLASIMQRWLGDAEEMLVMFRHKQKLEKAATAIQCKWRKERFARAILESVRIRKNLEAFIFRLRFLALSTRRRVNAKVLRTFLFEVSSRPLSFFLYRFQKAVLRAQYLVRSFARCKLARLEVLRRKWRREEKELFTIGALRKKKRQKIKEDKKTLTPKRRILSRKLKSAVANMKEDRSTKEIAQRMHAPAAPAVVENLCRFFLEDCRRHHMNQNSPLQSSPKALTRTDAKRLLYWGDDEIVFNNSTQRKRNVFKLYSRKETFIEFIEDLQKGGERAIMSKINERLNAEDEVRRANNFAAEDDSTNELETYQTIGQPSQGLSDQHEIPLEVIHELQELFHFMRLCSNQSSDDIDKLMVRVGIQREEGTKIKFENMQFESFLENIVKENKSLQYPRDVIKKAFDFFAAVDEPGVIRRKLLRGALQKFGLGKVSKEKAASLLNSVGLTKDLLDYDDFLDSVFLSEQQDSLTLYNFLRI